MSFFFSVGMMHLNIDSVCQWECCGVTGHTDWHDALQEKTVPDRCCQEHYRECGRNATNIFWSQVQLGFFYYLYIYNILYI